MDEALKEIKPTALVRHSDLDEKADFIKHMRKQKYCTPRCPAFDFCPVMPMAQNASTPKKPCVMGQMGEKIRRRFERLFIRGQDGLITELMDTLYHVGLKTNLEGTLGDHRAYAGLLLNTSKALYGEKLEVTGEQSTTIHVKVVSIEDEIKKKRMKGVQIDEVVQDAEYQFADEFTEVTEGDNHNEAE